MRVQKAVRERYFFGLRVPPSFCPPPSRVQRIDRFVYILAADFF